MGRNKKLRAKKGCSKLVDSFLHRGNKLPPNGQCLNIIQAYLSLTQHGQHGWQESLLTVHEHPQLTESQSQLLHILSLHKQDKEDEVHTSHHWRRYYCSSHVQIRTIYPVHFVLVLELLSQINLRHVSVYSPECLSLDYDALRLRSLLTFSVLSF